MQRKITFIPQDIARSSYAPSQSRLEVIFWKIDGHIELYLKTLFLVVINYLLTHEKKLITTQFVYELFFNQSIALNIAHHLYLIVFSSQI